MDNETTEPVGSIKPQPPPANTTDVPTGLSQNSSAITLVGEQPPPFDLGGGGRAAWYEPTTRTIFPVKKGAAGEQRPPPSTSGQEGRTDARSTLSSYAAKEGTGDHPDRYLPDEGTTAKVMWEVTEQEVERFMEEQKGCVPLQLRGRRSLEEDVLGIEDVEVRRLTGIAYLT